MADPKNLEAELMKLGLWNATGPDGRVRYQYKLVPGEFRLTGDMRAQLSEIALMTTGALRASAQLSYDLGWGHREAQQPGKKPLSPKEAAFLKMLRAACGGYEFPYEFPVLPPIVKVDLAWDGTSLRVVEIDTYNPRGLAYALWLRYIHVEAGELDALRDSLLYTLLEAAPSGGYVWLYSDRERYYTPVMKTAASILNKFGVKMRVVGERDVQSVCPNSGFGLLREDENLVIVPDRMHQNIAVRNDLVSFVQAHPDRTLMPYVPQLGAKSLMAFLTNGNEDPEIASWQQEYIDPAIVPFIDAYLPKTAVLGRQFTKLTLPDFVDSGEAVLKAINSSGAKGVYMPHGWDDWETALAIARGQKTPNFIAQELVEQQQMSIEGVSGPEDHFVRITAYVATGGNGTCIDAELTGTGDDPLVHGGTSCIQLPAIF